MKYTKYLSIGLLSLFMFNSCENEDSTPSKNIETDGSVRFTTTLIDPIDATRPSITRASGTSWAANDKIGIFMKKNNQSLNGTNIVDGTDNFEFTTSGGNDFTPISDANKIYFPINGDVVDFVSYYPYQASINNYTYNVDISNQGDLAAIDLMYSDNAKGKSITSAATNLQFSHKLTNLVFNITAGTGITSLTGVEVTISGLPTKADFNLANGVITTDATSTKDFKANVLSTGAKAEAIVIPSTSANLTVTFKLGTNTFSHAINSKALIAGNKYTFNVTLKTSGGHIEPVNGWIETPLFEPNDDLMYSTTKVSSATGSGRLERNFSMLFDKKYHVAHWVAYPLHADHMGSGRTNAWQYDPNIPTQYQPNLSKGWPGSGYDRGHQIASSDRNASDPANRQTFYYSNMTLQQSNFNQGIWNVLEQKVQSWAKTSSDTVYVVTGVMITTKDHPTVQTRKDNSQKECALPPVFYKAIAKKVGGQYYTIGYRMNNVSYSKGDNFQNYKTTVAKLEEETGYTFFPSIDPAAKQIIDNKGNWN